MKILFFWMVLCLMVPLAGCAEFEGPDPSKASLLDLFGSGVPLSRGDSKAEVLENWGRPDQVIPKGSDELGNVREEWVYMRRAPHVGLGAGSAADAKHLLFEGNSLVRWWAGSAPEESLPPSSGGNE